MGRRLDWRTIGGAAALLAAAAVLVAAFFLMGRPSAEEMSLTDLPDERFGWSYELLKDGEVQPYEPVFGENGYWVSKLKLPEGTDAVRMVRVMAEDMADAELEWFSSLKGIEVFLDGDLLYTDFPQTRREQDGFVRPSQEEWERIRARWDGIVGRVCMSLPADYAGRELAVINYFPEDMENPYPEYPHLNSQETDASFYVANSLKTDVVITVYALLALLIVVMFLLEARSGGGDGKTLLLCLYFLLLFFKTAGGSYSGYYSGLRSYVDVSLLNRIYMVPLYLYLALRLEKRWNVVLGSAVAAWALYEVVRWILAIQGRAGGVADTIGPGSLAVFLAVTAALCAEVWKNRQERHDGKKIVWIYGLAAAAVTVSHLIDRSWAWGGLSTYLRDGIWEAVRAGNFDPAAVLITGIVSAMAVIAVILEFVLHTIRVQQENSVLQERARQTMESYERLVAAEDSVEVLHHEMSHHMTALSGILQSGDTERAARYMDAVASSFAQLPEGRYSKNMLVNVIAGSYLDRAKAQQIRVEHHLNVPPELKIADEDLSVFLSNMLQNALEACERMGQVKDRYIWVDMHLRGDFLSIECANSAPDEPEETKKRPHHGYGIAAMRAIAKKYNSVLVVERTRGEYSVSSDFCLEER